MKRYFAAGALLLLFLPLGVSADVIDDPLLLAAEAAGASPIAVVLLVAALALGTTLLIRTLAKSNKGKKPPQPAEERAPEAQDAQTPPEP